MKNSLKLERNERIVEKESIMQQCLAKNIKME